MKPIVMVGEAGITDAVLKALAQALLDHELVKVRLRETEDRKQTARMLAERSDSELCGVVGRTVILYRAHPDEPRIELPIREA
jgi:RNA-binding protein